MIFIEDPKKDNLTPVPLVAGLEFLEFTEYTEKKFVQDKPGLVLN